VRPVLGTRGDDPPAPDDVRGSVGTPDRLPPVRPVLSLVALGLPPTLLRVVSGARSGTRGVVSLAMSLGADAGASRMEPGHGATPQRVQAYLCPVVGGRWRGVSHHHGDGVY